MSLVVFLNDCEYEYSRLLGETTITELSHDTKDVARMLDSEI
jgi:hypothetical protein